MNIAVVIPSKNASNLVACLAALRKHEPEVPVIVVDDGIQIPAEIAIAEFDLLHHNLKAVNGEQPFIFARNINIGIRAAGPRDGFILCNDDALLESPGGFQLLAKACEADPSIGVIGAVTNLTGQPLQFARRHNSVGGVRIVPHIAFVACYIPQQTITTLWKVALDSVLDSEEDPELFTAGALDERFVGYGCDDADYCEQVTRAGLKVAVHDGCFVDHSKLHSSYRGEPRTGGDYSSNFKLLMDKWGTLVTQPELRKP